MKLQKYSIIVAVMVMSTISLFAKSEIKVHLRNAGNIKLTLGHRFEDRFYIVDTIITDQNGNAVFTNVKPWHKGIYFIALQSQKMFDFIVSENQTFSITSDTIDMYKYLQFQNSPENDELAKYQLFIREQHRRSEQLTADKKQKPQDAAIYDKKLDEIDAEVRKYIDNAIAKNKGTFLGDILVLLRPINAQQLMPPADTSNFAAMQAWRQRINNVIYHYFDVVNFNEIGLIYTPFLKSYFEFFFNELIEPYPDTVAKYLDMVIEKGRRSNDEMYRYLTEMFFVMYQLSEIMSHDAVVVYIAEKYYLSGAATWADSTYISRIADKVKNMRLTLVGNKAPSLMLQNIDGGFSSLDTVNARFTILCFYSPSCGHCRREVPKLWDLYDLVRDRGVKVFAVYTEYERAEWEKFVRIDHKFDWINVWDGFEGKNPDGTATTFSIGSKFREIYDVYSTPSFFLLDENKNIIAKRINVEILTKIIYDKLHEYDEDD